MLIARAPMRISFGDGGTDLEAYYADSGSDNTCYPTDGAVSLFELGAAAVGAHFGSVAGLSLGWVAAVYIEAVFMFNTVFKAAFPLDPSSSRALNSWQICSLT